MPIAPPYATCWVCRVSLISRHRRHPLSSRRFKGSSRRKKLAQPECRSPNGKPEARVAEREGRQVVQARNVDGEWLDASPGTFEGVHSLVWAPSDRSQPALTMPPQAAICCLCRSKHCMCLT